MSDDYKSMKIYEEIDALMDYIDECRSPMLNGNKKVVDMDDIDQLIKNIKLSIPDDIRKSQSVINDADTILKSAADRAKQVTEQATSTADGITERARVAAAETRAEAEREREKMLSENEITIEANARAKDLIEQTEEYCRKQYEEMRSETAFMLEEAERCLRSCSRQIHTERDRVSERKIQSRYEDYASEENEQKDYAVKEQPQSTNTRRTTVEYDEEDAAEEYEAEIADEEETDNTENTRQRREHRTRVQRKPSLSERAKNWLYGGPEEDDETFADDGSFDSSSDAE